jgi:serine phosphatase RsbU (regulator of sigma subunit)
VAAAAAMARLQSALRILARSGGGPAEVLERLDQASDLIADSVMTTVGYADYDPATRILRYSCAGHPPPLLVTGDRANFLWAARCMPIGVQPSGRTQAECVVPPVATLVWYTDGLVERRDESTLAALDSFAALATTFVRDHPDAFCRKLLRHMFHERTAEDDTAVLCVRFLPSPVTPVRTEAFAGHEARAVQEDRQAT